MAKKKHKDLRKRKAITGYLYIAPFIIGFLAFMVLPLIESFRMSFSNVLIGSGSGGFVMEFVGLANIKKAFLVDPEFNRFLTDELSKMVIHVPTTLIVSFFMALLLNQSFKGRGMVRAIFFLPVILSSGVLVGLEFDNSLLAGMQDYIKANTNTASITTVLREILSNSNFGTRFLKVVFEIVDGVYDVVIASGIQIIIFLSGLQTISKSMYEAATIEGCTHWESFWKITLPMVSSVILVNMIYTIIDFFMRTDSEMMDKISSTMIAKMDYGFSSAMAWIYFVAVILIIAVFSAIISKWVYYYE
ncbi:lactose ABC transporter permease [Anaerocolumna cellulosilytica]|uniref:Lactose ABC transporter permease n=1 Tax=Anaerocolumna cellulosilytica TaxID=433286 RepID=A0A6S6R3D4_9FIRM|nr:sugar ABC transporter permease [Anaerocolumna cellulosilytica]MBB5197214.1 ABC-type sugar transport system permease subunit [Anaerocolumna cellulosilytica]BCJ94022.1 lactose ABC transporter permease [Anaerocolumna cellulosilytica]